MLSETAGTANSLMMWAVISGVVAIAAFVVILRWHADAKNRK